MPKRVDANQVSIVEGLRAIGASVEPRLSKIGRGCPDLLVGYHGRDFIFELKVGDVRLTSAEQEWRDNWRGTHYVVRSLDEAIAVLQYRTGER